MLKFLLASTMVAAVCFMACFMALIAAPPPKYKPDKKLDRELLIGTWEVKVESWDGQTHFTKWVITLAKDGHYRCDGVNTCGRVWVGKWTIEGDQLVIRECFEDSYYGEESLGGKCFGKISHPTRKRFCIHEAQHTWLMGLWVRNDP